MCSKPSPSGKIPRFWSSLDPMAPTSRILQGKDWLQGRYWCRVSIAFVHVISAPVSSCARITVVKFLRSLGGGRTLCLVSFCISIRCIFIVCANGGV